MNPNIVPELDLIAQAEAPVALWRPLRRYFRCKGFEGMAYFIASPNERGAVRGFTIIHKGYSPVVKQTYVDEGWGAKDPGPAFALAQGCPVRWSRSFQMFEMDEEQQAFLAKMREIGLGDGYTFPVFGPRGRHGAIALGNVADQGAMEAAPLDEMHLIAQAAHMRMCQLLPDLATISKPLSARELEILEWVARGKSNGVIAEILDLSAATIDTYLRRIFTKLDVSDRTSAAVRGVGMGLIAA